MMIHLGNYHNYEIKMVVTKFWIIQSTVYHFSYRLFSYVEEADEFSVKYICFGL